MNILQYKDNNRIKRAISQIKDIYDIRVLFVCLGNICRSPAAEEIMNAVVRENNAYDRWNIDSAGTGGYHIGELPDSRMRAHAQRRGLSLKHRCRQLTADDFNKFDIIIGMDASNISNIRHAAPSPDDEIKILPMALFFNNFDRFDHVPDPYYEGAEGFELVLDMLTEATRNLYDTVTESVDADK